MQLLKLAPDCRPNQHYNLPGNTIAHSLPLLHISITQWHFNSSSSSGSCSSWPHNNSINHDIVPIEGNTSIATNSKTIYQFITHFRYNVVKKSTGIRQHTLGTQIILCNLILSPPATDRPTDQHPRTGSVAYSILRI